MPAIAIQIVNTRVGCRLVCGWLPPTTGIMPAAIRLPSDAVAKFKTPVPAPAGNAEAGELAVPVVAAEGICVCPVWLLFSVTPVTPPLCPIVYAEPPPC